MSRTVALPPSIRSRLTALAGRTRLLRAVRGAGVLVLFLTVSAGLALAADYFFEFPSLVRQALFVSWAGLGFALFFERLCLPVLRRIDDASLAAAVDQTYPDMNERLSTAVSLADKADVRHGAPAFVALIVEDTEQAAGPLDFEAAVPGRSAVGFAAAASFALVLLLSPAVAGPAEYGDLAHRFFRPWSELPPYTFTVTPGDVKAARGSSVTVDVAVHPRSSRVRLPASASIVLIDADGTETSQRMRVERSDAFSFPLSVSADSRYRIEARATAGDALAASATFQVTAVMPVELATDSPAITVTPPAYARATRDEETVSGLVDLIALQGSLVRFDVRFTRPAVSARLEWAGADTKTSDYPLVLSDEGRAAELSLPALATGSYRLILEAEYGIRTQLDGGTLTVKPDLPPSVITFTGRDDLKAVTPYDKIPLECKLADDVGVARAAIEYRVNDGNPVREAIPLKGAGRLEASGELLFALDGKARDGDTITYRLRVADNLPAELKGPHVVYAPADHWLSLKVAREPGPVREQEIAAQRDAIDRRIEAIRRDLLREMRDLYKLKLESLLDPALSSEQRDALGALQEKNRAAEKAMREMVREAESTPMLLPLADAARGIADHEMQQSEAALQAAGTARTPPPERDGHFKESDDHLGGALQKLDNLKKQNEQVARDRADQLRFEALADKQQKLADKAAELAKKDPANDPAVKEQAEQLRREQAQTAEELKRLAEQSPVLQKSLDQARAEEAKQAADRARELADAERALAKARTESESEGRNAKLTELAEKQRELADKAARLADETKSAARSARLQPLRPEDTRRATDALKDGDAKEAARQQENAARNLERLADGLDRAIELGRDPREAARQLARLQDDLRQRVQDEMYRKNAERPLAERLTDLSKEQDAIRKSAEKLAVPPDDADAGADRKTAADKAAAAADLLRKEEPRQSLGQMEQTKRALEQLASRLPTLAQRQQDALREIARLREEQEEVARQTEQAARDLRQDDGPKARAAVEEKLADAAKRQARLADGLAKVDLSAQEPRRERVAEALKRALADLQNKLPEDARASQQEAKLELERLEQSLSGRKPADEQARELAKKQQELAEAATRPELTDHEKAGLQRKQQELARDASSLPAPDAPQRQAEAGAATRLASKSADEDPTSPRTREKMADAARKLDELAKQLEGRESDADRADRLARRQEQAAADAERRLKQNPDQPPTAEERQSQDEITREAGQLRGGEAGQAVKRNAEKALEEAQTASLPSDRAKAQKQAADALRELAGRLAADKDAAKPDPASPRTARAAPDDAAASPESLPKGLPTKAQSDQARQLAREERELRDQVRKAANDERPEKSPPRQDPLGELAKQEAEVARHAAELANDVSRGQGEQSGPARQSESASRTTREAADRMRDGELPAARQAGKQAAEHFRQLSEDLAKTPRAEAENQEKDSLGQSRDLGRRQEEINRLLDKLLDKADARRDRQQARQQDLRQQAGQLQKDLDRLSKEMKSKPQAEQAAGQAADAAKDAEKRMEQADGESSSQAGQSRQEAARSLDRAARQAEQAASEQTASNGKREKQGQASPQAGQAVQQAGDQMEQAQGQLGQGETPQARRSMENAAKALRKAAGELSRGGQQNQGGDPNQPGPPGMAGSPGGGRPDPSVFGPGIPKYAGKTWGELPGELRTQIVQDMKAKYGEDYARMIKLYFEQLADTKRDGK
jgi:hypothetical protein